MKDFYSKEIKTKASSIFTVFIHKFNLDVFILLLIDKIEVGSKLNKKRWLIYL